MENTNCTHSHERLRPIRVHREIRVSTSRQQTPFPPALTPKKEPKSQSARVAGFKRNKKIDPRARQAQNVPWRPTRARPWLTLRCSWPHSFDFSPGGTGHWPVLSGDSPDSRTHHALPRSQRTPCARLDGKLPPSTARLAVPPGWERWQCSTRGRRSGLAPAWAERRNPVVILAEPQNRVPAPAAWALAWVAPF